MTALLIIQQIAPTAAQSPSGTIGSFDATFRDWMQENGVAKGMLAVAYKGRLVFERGYGGQDPNERVLLASLSKAITGRCIAELIIDRRLAFDGKVGDVLAPFFRQHGEPADPRIREATVQQLLVHRAGFPPAPRDLMTPAAVELLQKTKSPATATPAELLSAALTAPLASAPGEAFRYSNIGYLVLGVMVESVTGESYEQYCGRTLLVRAGIRAPALDKEWRAFSSFGGWRLSPAEYLAFLTRREDRMREADLDRRTSAGADNKPGVHKGSWGVSPDTVGMQAMQHDGGASWFVWYGPRPGKDATDALMERLAALPATIASWPAFDLFPERGFGPPVNR